MKVKIIGHYDEREFEKRVNLFIKSETIIDIKFTAGIDRSGDNTYTALIMYVKENE